MSEMETRPAGDMVGTAQDRGVVQEGDFTRYSTDERARLRALMDAGDASDADLDVLAMVAERSGLDPFLKQLYLVGRRTKVGGYRGEPERWETKWTVQSSIDGLREVLFRTADMRGVDCTIGRPVWFDADGNPRRYWSGGGHPDACEVEVRLGGRTGYGIATWEQFCQTTKTGAPNSMWTQMGPHMLAKCAKALAIRDVCSLASGIFIPEEMGQASNRQHVTATRLDVKAPELGVAGLDSALKAPELLPPEELSEVAQIARAEIAGVAAREEIAPILATYRPDLSEEDFASVRAYGTERWHELAPHNAATDSPISELGGDEDE